MVRERDIQGVDDIAQRRHWEDFLNDPGVANKTLVREFYANLRFTDQQRHTVMVRADNWLRFVSTRLLPSSHTSKVTREHAVMIFAILTDVPFDIGCFLHKSILKSAMGGLTIAGALVQPRQRQPPQAGLEERVDRLADKMHIPMSNRPLYPPNEPAEPPPADIGDE
ncbi:hypothetical protein CDL12_25577 [Handroanthus impetiginosus]|uniref:Uncharacterized protein n=1 Tax=Handroanthus impetiginosus TaxID=429701 RepID=A0A2G9G9E9_9LAMI|nr:hypothetical protein CDL12_25577 [Handroanthus impetiginosus]